MEKRKGFLVGSVQLCLPPPSCHASFLSFTRACLEFQHRIAIKKWFYSNSAGVTVSVSPGCFPTAVGTQSDVWGSPMHVTAISYYNFIFPPIALYHESAVHSKLTLKTSETGCRKQKFVTTLPIHTLATHSARNFHRIPTNFLVGPWFH